MSEGNQSVRCGVTITLPAVTKTHRCDLPERHRGPHECRHETRAYSSRRAWWGCGGLVEAKRSHTPQCLFGMGHKVGRLKNCACWCHQRKQPK